LRLFVALDLDDDARRVIGALQHRVAETLGADRSIKAVDPAHMHLTLAFLGEIADRDVPAIVETLSTDIIVPRFAAVFQGLGVFPPRGAPRVLWVGVGEGSDQIVEVQRVVARRLEGLGIALEPRPFHPHLTLARWRISGSADRPHALPAASPVFAARVNVDHVTLYQSRPSPAGAIHTALTRSNLT